MTTNNPMIDEASIHRILEAIAAARPQRFRADPIRPDMSLSADLGISSLGMVALLVRIEELLSLDVELAEIDIAELQTVGDVLQLVVRATTAAA